MTMYSGIIRTSYFSISSGELTAAQKLVDTYIVILRSRSTLNDVIKKSGVDYSYEEMREMVAASAVNNTEIFSISVTSEDKEEAERIANLCVGETASVQNVKKELKAYREICGGEKPSTVYIGGGTPTALNAAELDELLEEVEEVGVLLQVIPIKPADLVVLTIGIVVTELGVTHLVT